VQKHRAEATEITVARYCRVLAALKIPCSGAGVALRHATANPIRITQFCIGQAQRHDLPPYANTLRGIPAQTSARWVSKARGSGFSGGFASKLAGAIV
jgi:hypothetical protein